MINFENFKLKSIFGNETSISYLQSVFRTIFATDYESLKKINAKIKMRLLAIQILKIWCTQPLTQCSEVDKRNMVYGNTVNIVERPQR